MGDIQCSVDDLINLNRFYQAPVCAEEVFIVPASANA